jgi:hypothetical protein
MGAGVDELLRCFRECNLGRLGDAQGILGRPPFDYRIDACPDLVSLGLGLRLRIFQADGGVGAKTNLTTLVANFHAQYPRAGLRGGYLQIEAGNLADRVHARPNKTRDS